MLQNKTQVETVNFRLNFEVIIRQNEIQYDNTLYFILSDDDFEIKSKIYSFNLRLVLKHILHSRDDFFWNLFFILLFYYFFIIVFYYFSIAYLKSHRVTLIMLGECAAQLFQLHSRKERVNACVE